MTAPTLIEAAAERLRGHVRCTPLLSSSFLDEIAGRRVLVKPECLQHTGSFKFRGAWSAVSALPADVRARGVLAFSSGNHGQGVALAARRHGVPAVIVMPADAPRLKIDNTRALGAEVVLYHRTQGESREDISARLVEARGLTLIHPYDAPQVIAGQGTIGLELAEQAAQAGVGPGLVVSDDEALRAMALAFTRLKIVLEPGGAVALAAALFHPEAIADDTVIAVASGGNVDADLFRTALARFAI